MAKKLRNVKKKIEGAAKRKKSTGRERLLTSSVTHRIHKERMEKDCYIDRPFFKTVVSRYAIAIAALCDWLKNLLQLMKSKPTISSTKRQKKKKKS